MFLEGKVQLLDSFRLVFVLEAVALVAFGLSWLVKGNVDFSYLPRKIGLIK
jgi:hypothetical protein